MCWCGKGNCFQYALSSGICSAERVEVLSLNGLGAAATCDKRTVVPLSGVALFNTIGGTIPTCVWSLQNLTVLHLTGNGLTGEIVSSLPPYSHLVEVSVSHNQLSGALPLDIVSVVRLDLSHNQFAGEYPDHTYGQSIIESKIDLEINRLSGQLPVSELEQLLNSSSLSVLRGNVFSCNTIPSNDEYTEDYVCGSRNLNYAMFVFVSAVAMVMLVLILIQWGRMPTPGSTQESLRIVTKMRSKCVQLWKCFTCLQNLDTWHRADKFAPALPYIIALRGSFADFLLCAMQLVTIVLAGSSVLYAIKALDSSGEYATHSHVYSWFWTLAYMRGVVPAGLLLMVWVGAITASFYRIVANPLRRWNDDVQNDIEMLGDGAKNATHVSVTWWSIVSIGMVIILNVCIVVTANALYIHSIQLALSPSLHLFLQLSMSIFRLLYSAVVCPALAQPVRNATANVRFRFMLLMMNNLLIPGLVTVFTSDACFQVN